MDDVRTVCSEEAVIVIVGGGEGGLFPAGVDERCAEAGFDLARGIVLEGKVVDEFASCAFFDGGELVCGIVSNLI